MKNIIKSLLLFTLVIITMLSAARPVSAQGIGDGDSPVIFGSDYVLAKGQTINDLVVFGGNVVLESGSLVTGDVVVFGGNIAISGEVRGDVTDFGGNVVLNESSLVGGDLFTLGGASQVAPGATVRGQRVTGVGTMPLGVPTKIYTPTFWVDLGPSATILSAVMASLILALLAVLMALFLPHPTERVAQTIGSQPVISGGIGLLTLVVTPALLLVLAITVILIPLALLGILLFGIAILFGWIAIGLQLGKWLSGVVNNHWPEPVSAGVGTLLISLVSNLALFFTGEWFWALCCIGIPMVFILTMIGLGGVVASKFGAQVYNPNAYRPAPPQPPAPVEPSSPAALPPSLPVEPAPPTETVENNSNPAKPPFDLPDQNQ